MDKHEFENEMNEYIHDIYKDFQSYQTIVNGILDGFHTMCKDNNIPYFVAFGSLLGFVRDGDNVPWDYDIDVVVPIEYKEQLIQVLQTKLSSDLYYVYDNNMNHYPASCLRVCKKGYTYMAFHVDVFFLFGCPDDNSYEQKKFMDKLVWLYRAREAHNGYYHFNNRGVNRIRLIINRILAWIKYPITNKQLIFFENRLCQKYPLRQTSRCTIYYPSRKSYSTSCFNEHQSLYINGKEYYVPSNPDLLLTELYGDYKNYLPISERFDEFYNMYRIVNERQDYYTKYLKEKVE